jgi:hypothetical protein
MDTALSSKAKIHNEGLTKQLNNQIKAKSSPLAEIKSSYEMKFNKLNILQQIQKQSISGNRNITPEQLKELKINFPNITAPDHKLTFDELQMITKEIPKALVEYNGAKNNYEQLQREISKLERKKSTILESKGLASLNARTMLRKARMNESQRKYGLFKNTVKTAKSFGGLTTPDNKSTVTSTQPQEKLKIAISQKAEIKQIKGLITNTDPRYQRLNTIKTMIDGRIKNNNEQLKKLRMQLITTINEKDRQVILEDINILTKTIEKDKRNLFRIYQRVPILQPPPLPSRLSIAPITPVTPVRDALHLPSLSASRSSSSESIYASPRSAALPLQPLSASRSSSPESLYASPRSAAKAQQQVLTSNTRQKQNKSVESFELHSFKSSQESNQTPTLAETRFGGGHRHKKNLKITI